MYTQNRLFSAILSSSHINFLSLYFSFFLSFFLPPVIDSKRSMKEILEQGRQIAPTEENVLYNTLKLK